MLVPGRLFGTPPPAYVEIVYCCAHKQGLPMSSSAVAVRCESPNSRKLLWAVQSSTAPERLGPGLQPRRPEYHVPRLHALPPARLQVQEIGRASCRERV